MENILTEWYTEGLITKNKRACLKASIFCFGKIGALCQIAFTYKNRLYIMYAQIS